MKALSFRSNSDSADFNRASNFGGLGDGFAGLSKAKRISEVPKGAAPPK